MMTKSLHCVSFEIEHLPTYDGLTDVDCFLDAFEREVSKKHCFHAFDCVLRAMPIRWWGTYKDNFID